MQLHEGTEQWHAGIQKGFLTCNFFPFPHELSSFSFLSLRGCMTHALGCAERATSQLSSTAAPALCLSPGFPLLLSVRPSVSASSEETFCLSLTKKSIPFFVFCYSVFHSSAYCICTISLDQRGWLAELGCRFTSARPYKNNISQLLTGGLTIPTCRPPPPGVPVLVIQGVNTACCACEVTGLIILPLLVLQSAGWCELVMMGSGVQKAL